MTTERIDADMLDRPDMADMADTIEGLLAAVIPEQRERLHMQGEIARGGMASIHLGIDRALRRRVATKLLLDDHQHSMLAVRSFVREAQITGQLDHPNIVPVHELGVDEDGRLFFTMKLVEGRTLHDLIQALRSTHDRVNARGLKTATVVEHDQLLRLLDVFLKVLDAVAFAHSRGVVHCDLKPDNVMVGDYGQVYLMDWGIAKVLPPPVGGDPLARNNRITDALPVLEAGSNLIMGTPAYMSPEQARGDQRQIDTRSDVFALGAMLFEILTGHPPYQGRSAVEVLLKAEDAEAKLPDHLPIARELRRIVGVAMAPESVDRYQRVELMQADLQSFTRGGGNFPRHSYAPGDWIIREGEVGDAAYIVISGRCEVLKQIEGMPELLRTLGPGDVFGETAILASTPRTASIRAVTEVVAVTVTAEVLEREVDAMKPWMGAFIRALAQRFSEVKQGARAAQEGDEASNSVVVNTRTGRTQRSLRRVDPNQLSQRNQPSHPGHPGHPGQRNQPSQGSLSEPAQVANQAMMLLKSWGKWDRDLGNVMSLERACAALSTICGLDQHEVLTRLRSFKPFMIETKHDSISLRDERALRDELQRVLKI